MSDHISDLKLLKASLTCPLEQRTVNSSIDLEAPVLEVLVEIKCLVLINWVLNKLHKRT